MRVIFLDIDGVLNADCDFGGRSKPNPRINGYCGICRSHVRSLKYIVDKTDAKIVLVSSWKNDYVDYLRTRSNNIGKYLRNKLRQFDLEIYDTTLKYDFADGGARGYEISQWIADHPEVDSWVVLDDVKFSDYDFLKITPHLVQTDEKWGLWSLPAHEAVYKLTGVKDQYLIDHEKFSECVQNVVSAMMPEIKEEKLAIIIPEVSKDE